MSVKVNKELKARAESLREAYTILLVELAEHFANAKFSDGIEVENLVKSKLSEAAPDKMDVELTSPSSKYGYHVLVADTVIGHAEATQYKVAIHIWSNCFKPTLFIFPAMKF